MKRFGVAVACATVLLFGNCVLAGVSYVRNGSFEQDGYIANIATQPPLAWCDVNIPGNFAGFVDSQWSTHGYGAGYSLAIYSAYSAVFVTGDMACVSQSIRISPDSDTLLFDLKLDSWAEWDNSRRRAVVMIDGTDVWDSNQAGLNANGEYLGRAINVSNYADGQAHVVTLGLRVMVDEAVPLWIQYQVAWDMLRFDSNCGGFGYLPHDLDHDCYINMYDAMILADEWLTSATAQYDLHSDADATVNWRDFAVLASFWGNMDCQDLNWCEGADFDLSGGVDAEDLMAFSSGWLEWSELFGDFDSSGSVDFVDFSELGADWMLTSDPAWAGTDRFSEPNIIVLESDFDNDGFVGYLDMYELSMGWLSGGCERSDVDGNGFVDAFDFAVLAGQWQQEGTFAEWQ
jgi:hypothetical protein